MAMEPRPLIIPTAPSPMNSHFHTGGEQGHSNAQNNPRVWSLHPEHPLSVTHYGWTLMHPARLQSVSVIHFTPTLLGCLRPATAHIPATRTQVTKAFQNLEVASRSQRRCGIWETVSGTMHARVHEDDLESFIQVNDQSNRGRRLSCTPVLLALSGCVRICIWPVPLVLGIIGDEPSQSFFQSIYPLSFLDTCNTLIKSLL